MAPPVLLGTPPLPRCLPLLGLSAIPSSARPQLLENKFGMLMLKRLDVFLLSLENEGVGR